MRRVVVYPGRIEVEPAEVPVPEPGEALVRSLVAGMCGSDLHAAHGRHPFVALPYRPGHEVVGVVESAAGGFAVGQRVIVEPDLPCWTCKMCTTGRENLCENLKFFGCRSEEHTSELQSHVNLVCRLLLEKKKTIPYYPILD